MRASSSAILEKIQLPRMFRVRQIFPRPQIDKSDIPAHIQDILSKEPFCTKVRPGMRIAITAGSRGIANVAIITKAISPIPIN